MDSENERVAETTLLQGPALGVLLGSGLGGVAETLPTEGVLPFEQVEGLGAATVAGHRGEIRRCVVSGRPCLFVCGRRHFYEGDAQPLRVLVQFLYRAGLRRLIITSAAGSLVKSVFPGELVMVSDVIDVQQRPPLKDEANPGGVGRPLGPRRLALDGAMSKDIWIAASRARVGLARGSVVSCAGPAYETAAEVRALQGTGASVVTMSGAPEVEAANSLGMRTAMIAVVTNWASGISPVRLCHDDVVDTARAATERLRRLVVEFVQAGDS